MKAIRITSTAILSLLLAIAAPAYAQHEQEGEKQDHPQKQESKHEQAKPEQQQSKHEQAKPEPQHAQEQQKQQQTQHAQQQQRQDENQQAQHAQQQQKQQQTQHAQQQQRQDENKQQQHAQGQQKQQQQHAQQQRGNEQPQRSHEQERVQQSAWEQHRSQRWDSDHRTWQQRGGYHGYRISDDRFRGYFGPDHGFRIYGLPFLVVGGYPRFQYQGYWFSLVDPWPGYWSNDWYDTDDVYVTYVDNGYYLFNRRHPNTGIAINISM